MPLCTFKGCLQNPADYSLLVTCAINICGALQGPGWERGQKGSRWPNQVLLDTVGKLSVSQVRSSLFWVTGAVLAPGGQYISDWLSPSL